MHVMPFVLLGPRRTRARDRNLCGVTLNEAHSWSENTTGQDSRFGTAPNLVGANLRCAMNAELNQNDEPLHHLLQSWRIDESLPPRFREGVWTRISMQETIGPASRMLDSIWRCLASLNRPALATAYFAVLVAAGAGFGYWKSERYVQQTEVSWQAAYLRSVNPYAALLPK